MVSENQQQNCNNIPFQRLRQPTSPRRGQRQQRHLKEKWRRLKIVGVLHMLNSMIVCSIGIFIFVELPLSKILNNNGLPILSSLFFMITGTLALMQNQRNMCSIISHNVCAVFSIIFSVVLVAVSIFGAMHYNHRAEQLNGFDGLDIQSRVLKCGFNAYISLVAFGLLQLLFSCLSISYGCGIYDCCILGCNECWNDSKQHQNPTGLENIPYQLTTSNGGDRNIQQPVNTPPIQSVYNAMAPTSQVVTTASIEGQPICTQETVSDQPNAHAVVQAFPQHTTTDHAQQNPSIKQQTIKQQTIPQSVLVSSSYVSPSATTQHLSNRQHSLDPISSGIIQQPLQGTNPFQPNPTLISNQQGFYQPPVVFSHGTNQANQNMYAMPQVPVSTQGPPLASRNQQFILVPVSTSYPGTVSGNPVFVPQHFVSYPSPQL